MSVLPKILEAVARRGPFETAELALLEFFIVANCKGVRNHRISSLLASLTIEDAINSINALKVIYEKIEGGKP